MNNNNSTIKTIELKLINEKFSLDTQYSISSLISDTEYKQFITQLNDILNDNRLLYVSFFLFVISFLFFGLFMNLSILFGWLLLVNFILFSVYFFYRYQKYNSYSRYMLMQEIVNNINKKKSSDNIPINFCLLLREKEINFYSGVSVDISLMVSYCDYEVYIPSPPPIEIPPTSSINQDSINNIDSYFVNDSNFCIPLDINNKYQYNNNDNNNKNYNSYSTTIQLSDGYTTQV